MQFKHANKQIHTRTHILYTQKQTLTQMAIPE